MGSRKWFKKRIPGSGLHIMCRFGGEDFQIAVMRWTDGLNPKVEEAVELDADLIVASLNNFDKVDILLNSIMEEAEVGMNAYSYSAGDRGCLARIHKLCEIFKKGV